MEQTDSCRRRARKGMDERRRRDLPKSTCDDPQTQTQCGDGGRKGGSCVEVGKVGEMGASIVVSTVKIKF